MTSPFLTHPGGGEAPWPRTSPHGSSTRASARPADNIPTGRWPANTAPSTAWWPRPMNGPEGSWLVSSPASTAAAALPCWHGSRAWTPTPSPAASASCAARPSPRPTGSGDPAPDGLARKKKSARPEALGRAAAGCHGRGPDVRLEVDAPLAAQGAPGLGPPRGQAVPDHDRAAVAPAGLLAADQPQAPGRGYGPRPGSAVPLPGAAAAAVPDPGPAGH